MNLDPRITSLSCWNGELTIEALSGGITNENYLVDDSGQQYVARLCSLLPHLGIHRDNEVACQRLAAGLGLAPDIHYHQETVLVSTYIHAKTLTAEDVRQPSLLQRLADTLRRLHEAWDQLEGELLYFSPLQTMRTYAATARRLGASLPADLDEAIDEASQLMHQVSPFTPTLCHIDLLAGNILDEGDRLWLIDWEYAGMGNPLYDLANLSGNCQLTEEQDQILLTAYRGRCVDSDLHDMKILKVLSLLKESLWAFIQTKASDIDFDYAKYARDNYQSYYVASQKVSS
jgi:thiamine kinase-like enzyme